MKSLFVLLGIFLSGVGPITAQTRNAQNANGLIGPVRSVRVEESKVSSDSDSSIETRRTLLEILTFDAKGSVTGQTVYNRDGRLRWKLRWGYIYGAQGREIERKYYNANGVLTSRGLSAYDDKGSKSEVTLYNPNGSVNHIQAYFYDDRGNMIRESHRNSDGTARNNIVRNYDSKGQLIEEIFYDGLGSFTKRSVFTYDDYGSQTAWTVYKADGTSVHMFRASLSYDAKGDVIGVVHYRSDGSIINREAFTYEFDAYRNWIKRNTTREVIKDDSSRIESEITYRKITYSN